MTFSNILKISVSLAAFMVVSSCGGGASDDVSGSAEVTSLEPGKITGRYWFGYT